MQSEPLIMIEPPVGMATQSPGAMKIDLQSHLRSRMSMKALNTQIPR